LGHGFHIPGDIKRLALIALGETIARILPLTTISQAERLNITLFSDAPLINLAPDLEAFPMQEVKEALTWADYFAVDASMGELDQLRQLFEATFASLSALRGQVLIRMSMPCSGLGKCGVCALKANRSWKLACEDGPVFELQEVLKGLSS
jgi:hypothetical protein